MIVHLESPKLLSIIDFFKTLQECLYSHYGQDKISFTAAYPNDNDIQSISTPMITYFFNQGLGSFGASGTKENKPRPGETQVFQSEKGRKIAIQLKRQRFDYEIFFEIWETNGERADRFATDFRKLLSSLTGYFQGLGVSEFIFQELNGSKPEKQWKTNLVRRELVYQLTMDEITSATSPTISAFGIEGFVYKTIIHLIEREGTEIGKFTVEPEVIGDPVAASTPRVATVKAKDDDNIRIRLTPQN